jgi:pyruvate dehydrogenase E2 component (dihydrolipoamide acetyltransferase)
VNGVRIAYATAGAGSPSVCLVHGTGSSSDAWTPQLDGLADVGRIVAVDLPGHGGSSGTIPKRIEDAAAVVADFLDALGIGPVVIGGHSMGGAIAAEVAIEYPQRVRGLVLVGSAGLGTREPLLFRVARWPVLGSAVVALRGRGLTARLLRSTYFDPSKVTEADVDQYYAPVALPGYGRALRAALRQFQFGGLEGRLNRIAAPTVVLWGEEDRWVPLGVGRALASGITRSAFLSVPRAGHSVRR